MQRSCAHSSCWVGDLPSGSCVWWVSWHRDGRGWSSAHTWVPPVWWNWSQACDRAVLWWILWMVLCDKVFAWLGSFIDDNVYLGHRCSMCTCLPLILSATLIGLCPWLELERVPAFHTCRFWFVSVTSIMLTACHPCLSLSLKSCKTNKPVSWSWGSSRCLHLLQVFS